MRRTGLTFVIAISVVFVPLVAGGQVQITEIMYSPEGADNGYEWIEIFNGGDDVVNITTWSFREGGTDHRLSAIDEELLAAGTFAVIADDPEKFLESFSTSAVILDSSFGLNNTGEPLALVSSDGVEIDAVTYDASDGADGNGNSLQLTGDGWVEARPTAGEKNASQASPPEDDENDGEDNFVNDSENESEILQPRDRSEEDGEDVSTSISAGSDRFVIAGVSEMYEVTPSRDEDTYDYRWMFGNGDSLSGQKVRYTYEYPGVYRATVVADDDKTLEDDVVVRVDKSQIYVSDFESGPDGFIQLENDLDRNVDLARWHIRAGGDTITIPDRVELLSNQTLTLSNQSLGIDPQKKVALLFPDGSIATSTRIVPTPTSLAESVPAFVEGSTATETVRDVGNENDSTGLADMQSVETESEDTNDRQTFSGQRRDESRQGLQRDPETTQAATASAKSDSSTNKIDLANSFGTSSQLASAGTQDGNTTQMWLMLLGIMVLAGSGALLLVRHFGPVRGPQKLLAANFDIDEL